MKPQWHFNKCRPSDRMRDPNNDAFFTAESLDNISEAVVREGIQNSLDAAHRGDDGVREVRVRICLVPKCAEETRQVLKDIFEPAKRHFEHGVGGISLASELSEEKCGYLSFEDFGTKGLTGDINEWKLGNAAGNAFFSFFRAEGISSKTDDKLGRWGIGKQVFPTASRLHAMFGLTQRADNPAKVLMGSAVIRSHSVDGSDYQPDAWFGCRSSEDAQVAPVTDTTFIERFCQIFNLQRGDKPGLSVVVPLVDERLSAEDLQRGIVRSFFWPILRGELVVEIKTPDGDLCINDTRLPSLREHLSPTDAATIEIANWAAFAKNPVEPAVASTAKPDWKTASIELLPEGRIAEIRKRIEADGKVAIRIPTRVRPKGQDRQESASYFTVFIMPCQDSGHNPVFLRDGIVITDVRSPRISGSRSLVVVEDPPLAGLLGDAEGVNHTQWQKDSPKFHGKYTYGPDTIKFVTRSVFEILQRLHAADQKGDPTLLMDLFFLPNEDEPSPGQGQKKPQPGPPPPISPPPPSSPKHFDLRRADGGFLLLPGKVPLDTFPVRVRIQAGYAVRRGDAISRWAPDDFAFTRAPLRQEPKPSGVVVTKEDGNTMELEIRKPDFTFGVTGFDKRRDLVVRHLELKGGDNETDV
jgi:hypothetical protein